VSKRLAITAVTEHGIVFYFFIYFCSNIENYELIMYYKIIRKYYFEFEIGKRERLGLQMADDEMRVCLSVIEPHLS